ncbi:MAG: excinuclease ABC subunit UvrA [Candidatus Kapabacteria bacterium]|nr:excinuclease ABC subunit UvrA [Candidatus Kapabacteria bacterium]
MTTNKRTYIDKAAKRLPVSISNDEIVDLKVLKAGIDDVSDIIVKGAREHNLKNVDIVIPRDKFTVITGLSGSGKSSLAFDTLYSEGQRRYMECLSAYARQFLDMLKKPEVDNIEGLSPAISIEQKSVSHNPRSTVGTVAEIYDYIRLLFARVGTQYCTDCDIPVEQKSIDTIIEEIYKEFPGKRIQILAPLVKSRKGHYSELFLTLRKQGFTRVRVDNEICEIRDNMKLSRYKIHDIELIVDRCKTEKDQEHRITESSELALQKGEGTMMLLVHDGDNIKEKLFSSSLSCPKCGHSYKEPSPNMFSFNSPYGACPTCHGLGETRDFDEQLVIRDKTMSVNDGGIEILGKRRDMWLWNQVGAFAKQYEIDLTVPISEMKEEDLGAIMYGTGKKSVTVEYKFGRAATKYKHKFAGVLPSFRHHYENTSSHTIKKNIENYMSSHVCPDCKGGRLKEDNLHIFIDGKSVHDTVIPDINDSYEFFSKLEGRLTKRQQTIAHLILKEIVARLNFLREVGLGYLTLNRPVRTLSGGESQRIRLASQIGSELTGIMYVLDEPSIGLHQHDNYKLINSLKKLRDLGNTVIVVEHDKAMIQEADNIVDIGPGAGIHGGEIIFEGSPQKLNKLPKKTIDKSLTAQYLIGKKMIEYPVKRSEGSGKKLILRGATGNNLKNVTLSIPLGTLTCVTGMSGSGKSTLINDTLYPVLARTFYRSSLVAKPYKKIEGLEFIDKVIEIDQSPIGRTPRSNPATYTGLFTLVRDFFAMMPEAKIRGYKAGRFSFNVKGGRCEECEGAGIKKIEMSFLPDVYVNCDVCNGKRYNEETLDVKYKGKSVADVLDMTVEESLEFFSEIPKIRKKIQALYDVGLTYIKLGQQAPTLSGGEAQRVKLATELSKVSTGKTIYLLDEPTTGLHFEDINVLMKLLRKLVNKGNTVVVIEHNMDVIKCADEIIDLGPEGGSGGGEIISQGTPEKIARSRKSLTGKYLKGELSSTGH